MRRNGFRCAPGSSGAGHLRPVLQVEAAEAAVQPQQQEQQRQQQQEWFDVMEEIAVGGERLQQDVPAEMPVLEQR